MPRMSKTRRPRLKRLIAALIIATTLSGCTTTSTKSEGSKIEKEKVLTIKPGQTTRDEVVSTFGAPAGAVTDAEGEHIKYIFKEKQVREYLGGLIVDEALGSTTTTTLELVIKEDGKVDSFKFKTVEE